MPSTSQDWITTNEQFERLWNFPNYKGTHSIVLLAVCDAQYRFTFDVGDGGRFSHGGVLIHSLGRSLESHELVLPAPRQLPGVETVATLLFFGDGHFSSKSRPHPGKHLYQSRAIFKGTLRRRALTQEPCAVRAWLIGLNSPVVRTLIPSVSAERCNRYIV